MGRLQANPRNAERPLCLSKSRCRLAKTHFPAQLPSKSSSPIHPPNTLRTLRNCADLRNLCCQPNGRIATRSWALAALHSATVRIGNRVLTRRQTCHAFLKALHHFAKIVVARTVLGILQSFHFSVQSVQKDWIRPFSTLGKHLTQMLSECADR
jgi:hypothetical protein